MSCRAFRQEEKQTKRNADLVDKNIIMSLLQMSMNRCTSMFLRAASHATILSPNSHAWPAYAVIPGSHSGAVRAQRVSLLQRWHYGRRHSLPLANLRFLFLIMGYPGVWLSASPSNFSCAGRWLSVRLETLGALSAFSAALLAVEQAGTASSTGLSLRLRAADHAADQHDRPPCQPRGECLQCRR